MFKFEQGDKTSLNRTVNVNEVAALVPGVYRPISRSLSYCQKNQRQERAVLKTGEINVYRKQDSNFFSNCFLILVEARWRWTLFSFFLAFTTNWLLFGAIYWCISYTHGDFLEAHLPQNVNSTEFTPCIENIYGFTSTFLFSVEIHTTVAYGRRAITLECPQTITAMCLQCIVSSAFQSVMIGILFAKLTRPRARTRTILFSKYSVITLRDGQLCLIFRVGDIRKSRIINIKPTAYLLKWDSEFDNLLNEEQIELKVETVECESVFFLWPVHVVHMINEESPFYNMSAADLLCCKIEILAVFEGIIESTGQSIQARASYTETDILWGHNFVPMITFNDDKCKYNVDFSKISVVEQMETPLCSANEYNSLVAAISSTFSVASNS
ncbi:PREDICTED: G protein-activated inward rectifier potassium channel 4-like [Papilio xuthus]|uniref:G protein-activated inward rectifier potassium channel 4-like n=1 Tax=Papilio xuthus TaxID=66420 RepID=A0AAJ6ZDZ5_PAPXU|nr:PREDICTED: G protein-activated inward rectifier potassium channel 4-like [Papilio xuthus]XP_013170648.1 PREDICTED: G protein-activated inward rectifier potassium channel 4-like [Papilio xuthus]XP_013170649.1 PREDICTED: G protein-activated inward rectifier potassium channel 4-like [Papilio xuthus]